MRIQPPRQRALLVRCQTPLINLKPQQPLEEIPQRISCLWPLPISHPLNTIRERLRAGVVVDPVATTWALKCSVGTNTGTQIHALATSTGLCSSVAVSNSLMSFYSKSGCFNSALKIFSEIPEPNVISWNTILCGFWSGDEALRFTLKMRQAGVPLDPVTFTTALSFSASLRDIVFVCQLHSLAFKSGFESDLFVGNALITAYSRRACYGDARLVFDEMEERDLVSWNALISGLSQDGNCAAEVIKVFVIMVGCVGLRPDHISFSSVIAACVHDADIRLGRQIHGSVAKAGHNAHVLVSNVLMSMYYKHGEVDSATKIFQDMKERNVISWTSMMSIHASNAVSLFNNMRIDGVQPNDVTFVALIYAISPNHSLKEGEMIHGICIKTRFSTEVNVSNSLITMYAKLGTMEGARVIFQEMECKEIVTWNAMVSGYAQNGHFEEALQAYFSAILYSEPNQYTFASVISSITAAETIYLTYGQRCHCRIIKLGLNTNEYVAGTLIHMYAKRGNIDESQMTFDETLSRSVVSWTAIISAHAKHGNFENVMTLFQEMVSSNVQPDHITLLAVLTACCCRGMVDVGQEIFDMMVTQYRLEPWPEHYACMVDMLGKAGKLVEAEHFLQKIPNGPGISALHSLLGACRIHGDVEMGKRAAESLMEKEPMESGAYILLSNMYAHAGDWDNSAMVRRWMKKRGVKKEVAFSWVDTGNEDALNMHKFSSDDNTHPLSEQIYHVAESLGSEMVILETEKLLAA